MNQITEYLAGYRFAARNIQILRKNWAMGKGRVKFVVSVNKGFFVCNSAYSNGYLDAFLDSVN